MKRRALIAGFTALLLSGCASHQLRFDPWKGLPKEAVADMQTGLFGVPKDKLIDAVAATLEHEPYLQWTFDNLDKANGLIIGSAGLFREVQVRVTDADGGRSRMAVSIPRRVLKTQAKIYVLRSDSSHRTAYEPEAAELPKYDVVAADAELDANYFYSFTYRVLNDRTQVPFRLAAYDDAEALGQPPAQAATPVAPNPDTTPVALVPAPTPIRRDDQPLPTPIATPVSDATKAARPE